MAECPPTAGFIKQLDPASPTDPDRVFCADDWFRFIQTTLKTNQFPKSEDGGNDGWDIALTVKASEVNSLQGIGSAQTVEQRLAALEADAATLPGGGNTVMSFHQAAAPSGWQQKTTSEYTNAMLRVVATAGGGSGGNANPVNMLGSQVPQHTHPGTVTGGGEHDHTVWVGGGGQLRNGLKIELVVGETAPTEQGTDASNFLIVNNRGTHSHGVTVDENSGPTSWTPNYIDMIVASKN